MRLWSLHPCYLDVKGLVALWREGLLARKVLHGRTSGYKNHPQLTRFSGHPHPHQAIDYYLRHVYKEAARRGYHFDSGKLGPEIRCSKIAVGDGQVGYEMNLLKARLIFRDPERYEEILAAKKPRTHPLFKVVKGGIEKWERVRGAKKYNVGEKQRRRSMGTGDKRGEAHMWEMMQKRLGYTDQEMKEFRNNPRNEEILSIVPDLINKTIVAEVVESHGCNSLHKVGDKLYFDSAGNLLTALSPKRICVYALSVITPQIFAATEFLYAGADPNQMRFKRAGCYDVGLACGGWGRVVLEMKVEDRTKS